MKWQISALVLTAGILSAADKPSDDVKKSLEKLQGTWKVEKAQLGGKDAPTPVEGIGPGRIVEAIPLDSLIVHRFGPDIALEGRITSEQTKKGHA